MKKTIVFTLLCSIIIIMSVTGCSIGRINIDTSKSVSIDDLQEQISNLQNKVDSYNKIYDGTLKKSIDKYCSNYLSFHGALDTDNVDKIKKYITSDYYNELMSQPFNEGKKNSDNYSQSTAADELYYENIAETLKSTGIVNQVNVVAICYQSIILDNNTTSSSLIYKFNMKYENRQWLISAVNILS